MRLPTTIGLVVAAASAYPFSSLAQQPGAQVPEVHPSLPSQRCSAVIDVLQQVGKTSSCTTEESSVVIDANWRDVNAVGTTNPCVADNKWNSTTCSTPQECSEICGLEGADYSGNFSIITTGQELNLKLENPSGVGTRVYMLDASGVKYKQFQLLNQEFTFDVDVSNLPCGSNGALYFVKMDVDGGTARFPANTAGATYGTGACGAQCRQDVHFLDGEANLDGSFGSCCAEMDIWEANSMAMAYTSHACSTRGQQKCTSVKDCGSADETCYTGWCDKNGCAFNAFRMGHQEFYGRGKDFDIDTTRPFTVVTQFVAAGNTETGELAEIRRLYKQDGRVLDNPSSTWPTLNGTDSITDAMCNTSKTYFDDPAYFSSGLAELGRDMVGDMTLAMSVWVDYGLNMSWLDSHFPGDDPTQPGGLRGNCPFPGGDPETIFAENPNAGVKFMNIRSGDFGSTY
ncbi:Exoglucanase 1 [Phytophthora cinnamomi]|uniref:Exoglucanase 1 n=1 Tax=Phytophthora cinnamomi TaxID=4785 RepID=UPI003559E1F7|nr:Exoglucanase 1 [Phytophthora cinnamomi]